MKKLFVLFLLSAFAVLTLNAQDHSYSRVSIQADQQQLQQLLKSGLALDHGVFEKESLICELSQPDIDKLESMGIDFQILIEFLPLVHGDVRFEMRSHDVDLEVGEVDVHLIECRQHSP